MTPIELMLVGGITGCVSAIVVLFNIEQARHKETKLERDEMRRRLEECERMRHNTASRVARLEAGCVLAACPLRKASVKGPNYE